MTACAKHCGNSYSAAHGLRDNRLMHGDNAVALAHLHTEFAGRIKCIYLDPPYNTGSVYEHYDDGVAHAQWLDGMAQRLRLMRGLLHEAGSVWISLDDTEAHYMKVLCDDLFGRDNFVANLIWEKRTTRENRRVFSFNHDHLLVFARDKTHFARSRNALARPEQVLTRYRNPDNDPRGPWQSVSALAQAGHGTASQFYTLHTPHGKTYTPPAGNCWRYTAARMAQEIAQGNIWFGRDGRRVPRIKKFLHDAPTGLTPETLWRAEAVGTNDGAKKHLKKLFAGQVPFATPKPEALLARIVHIATQPGDWVLDAFLGSGTTAAVAHKMRRQWIGLEQGPHMTTCCVPRLRAVVDGLDAGGVTAAAQWQGGGGFGFYTLS